MPNPSSASVHQDAVLWEFDSYGNNGYPQVKSPIQIKVRWATTTEEFNDPKRGPILSDAKIVCLQDIPVNSILWLGKQQDLPSPLADLYELRSFIKIPNVKATNFRRVGILVKYGDTLPTVV